MGCYVMTLLSHTSARPSHYNKSAEYYDAFNEKGSLRINQVIEKILKKNRVQTVLDFSCGTGSQVVYLAKRGFEVVGSDINAKMLTIAKQKARKEKISVKLLKEDMRTMKAGHFDAVITIFNAVGHLTTHDFKKAMQNIHTNLNNGGLYVFDIFNLSYLIKDNNITDLTLDWQKKEGNTKVREIQYSTIDGAGILASYTISHIQKGANKPKISRRVQTLQVYTAKQLRDMLQRHGFQVLRQCNMTGSRFSESTSERVITIAKKKT